MGKNKKNKQLDEVKNTTSPEVPVTDVAQGKKKKKKKVITELATTNTLDVSMDQNEAVDNKTKKEGKTANEEDCEEAKPKLTDSTTDKPVVEKKKKKKKKKQKGVAVENGTTESEESKNESGVDTTQVEEDNDEMLEKGQVSNEDEGVEDKDVQMKEPEVNNSVGDLKKKKKKKKQKAGNLENADLAATVEKMDGPVENSVASEKIKQSVSGCGNEFIKKKNKRKQDKAANKNESLNDDNEVPKKKKKKEVPSVDGDGEKKDNDSVGKENEEQENKTEDVDIGQWSTSAFEDAERQQKFVKLLGGAKQKDKSFSGIQKKLFSIGMSDVDDFKSGGTVAMTWKQQDKFMQTMETEFENARERNFRGGRGRGRGRGFGYKKAFGGEKKTSIDVSKSKSIKFDD